MDAQGIEKLKKAGQISVEIKALARQIIKPGMPLLEIAEKLEAKMVELGGKPAFPTNLSKDEIAAHSTPSFNDMEKAQGLLKVDVGVHVDGYVADTAFSLDLANDPKNQGLIQAAEMALKKATEVIALGIGTNEIGAAIESTIQSFGALPIHNLSGHSIERYDLHAGTNIPNFDNAQTKKVTPGLYAIEPFATHGAGAVKDGKPSGIYMLKKPGALRDEFARSVLKFIQEEYNTLPFCSRWLQKKFGSRVLLTLAAMEKAGILHHYAQLIEAQRGKVAQAEHTVLLTEKEKIITTV